MGNHRSQLSEARARSEAEEVEVLRRALYACRGCFTRVAERLGLGRRHVYKLVHRHDLWADVDRARALPPPAASPADLIARARSALRR